ncbi:hypothetical protein TRFO_02462 [Tritrichomonas foetus]|uniref:Vps53 N-terminal domain-containing protein n=1 Tax=Tritrichomonas foetus TaxID=1144522 RepID=A0A1J4L678_9EUKA|nr:hypothetical protein TRFO_02462 [Tritrichomonas foetus]|eukprot:OHT17454.1 hypothetical protein TRFO_02462 [Tritrichomonas foetus]
MSVNDVDKIDTLLANPKFDAISFVNELLPNEQSLENLEDCIKKLKLRSTRINSSIREAVRSYSVLGDRSEIILAQTQNSIVDLTKRIADIHDQATDTETIVSRFCEDIKPLDNAKRSLQTSIAALNRLLMIPKSIETLQASIERNDYHQCASDILALSSLFEYFQKYSKMDQIKPFYNQFYDLKRSLRNRINTELDSKLFRGSADESNIPICEAIDAFQDDFRFSTIELFCDKFLGPYDEAYRDSKLKDIKARFQWFKQRIDFFNKQYQKGFPKEWRMQYHITTSFCAKTTNHLLNVLNVTPNVKEYLFAFEYTVKFEQKMADAFATEDTVYINKDEPMPEFESTPEGIKEKYKYIFDRDNHVGRKIKVPANEFIGMIAGAFAPHMDLYLQAERESLDKVISTAGQKLSEELDNQNHILNSSTALIMAMKKTIDKCAGFNLAQSLLDLFLIIKELIIKYVTTLTRILPSRPRKDEHFHLICSIANTSSQLLTVISSLSAKVKDLVSDDTKPAINVEDARDSISGELKKQLVYLSDVIVKECEQPLIQVGNNQWREDDELDNTKLPQKLTQVVDDRFVLLDEWLFPDNFNRIRTTFVSRVVQVVHDSLFRTKNAEAQAARIIQSIKELKQLLIDCTKADSKMAKKRVDTEFAQIETELTVLCCPNVAMTGTYVTKARTPTKDHFVSILKLRGCTPEEITNYSQEYDQIYREMQAEENP